MLQLSIFARLSVTSSLSLQLLNQMTAFVFLKSYGILLESYLCQHCYTDVRIWNRHQNSKCTCLAGSYQHETIKSFPSSKSPACYRAIMNWILANSFLKVHFSVSANLNLPDWSTAVRFSWENCARHPDIHNTSCKIKYLADLLQLFCMCSQTTFRTQQEICSHENALHHMQDWRQRSFAFILQWRNFIVFFVVFRSLPKEQFQYKGSH